jgi:putative transposase
MLIHKAHRYELDPTTEQRSYFAQACGTARFIYNRGLADRIRCFAENEDKAKFPTAFDQMKDVVKLKQAEDFKWLNDIDSYVARYALINVERAFKHFWKGRKTGTGFPKFKKKGIKDAFSVNSVQIRGSNIKFPKLGLVKSKETPVVTGRILFATVRREADRWYVAITVEQNIPDPKPVQGPVVGIDLGVKTFATLSDGETLQLPERLGHLHQRLQWASRQHSRKQKGSQNRKKSALRLARVHRKIKNTRSNFIHEFTTRLAKTKQMIVIEDLAVQGMTQSSGKVCTTQAQRRGLNRKILSAAFSEVRRQLAYKTVWYGSKLHVVDRYFASSQLCSRCGHQQPMPLENRTYNCPICGLVLDRDLNAALNLEHCTAMPAGTNACGDERFMTRRKADQVLVTEAGKGLAA